MSFNSYGFLFIFLPVVVLGFWLLLRFTSHRIALGWLLGASVVFYLASSPRSLAIIAPSILLDYVIARVLLHAPSSASKWRNTLLAVGIAANIAALGYFKYKNFLLDSSNVLFGTHFTLAPLLLPLGISFLVFQKIAFLADVHVGKLTVVTLSDFLLFTLFFPRTIAGPIVHYDEVMPELRQVRVTDCATHVAVGLCLLAIGLAKKTLIADNLGPYVSAAFDTPAFPGLPDQPHTLIVSWVGVLAYALQLYFDFSGYSDMALGVARLIGVRLPMNFNSPFKAASIVEFWSRWHITLTHFLTAYIYTPLVLHLTRRRARKGQSILQGSRSKPAAIAVLVGLPTLVTMAISGLWHGAGWQFVLWGVLHGVYLTINQCWRLRRSRRRVPADRPSRITQILSRGVTFALVVLTLVFFRSDSIATALAILHGLVGSHGVLPLDLQALLSAGIDVPWAFTEWQLPLPAFIWIGFLLPAVMLLPNSLELLARFQPALDFPDVAFGTTAATGRGPRGVALNRMVATLAALLMLLSIMSIGHSGGFVYGQF